MAKIFLLKIADYYPESYWFKSKVLTGQDPICLKKGEEIKECLRVEFVLDKKVSVSEVLEYDFLFSDGPNFISPKLHGLLAGENIRGIQFFDADVILRGARYDGYKVLNFTSKKKAFNEVESRREPLLSYLPEGPQVYTEIVLKEDLELDVEIFRAEEDFTTILAVSRVRDLCEFNNVRGLQFKEKL